MSPFCTASVRSSKYAHWSRKWSCILQYPLGREWLEREMCIYRSASSGHIWQKQMKKLYCILSTGRGGGHETLSSKRDMIFNAESPVTTTRQFFLIGIWRLVFSFMSCQSSLFRSQDVKRHRRVQTAKNESVVSDRRDWHPNLLLITPPHRGYSFIHCHDITDLTVMFNCHWRDWFLAGRRDTKWWYLLDFRDKKS
jgi:hypothetical protein